MQTQRSRSSENWREAQQARISLWIRETVKGWIYFDSEGHARLLATDEARKLEREASRLLDRHSEREFTAGAIVAILSILGLISVGGAAYFAGWKTFAATALALLFFSASAYETTRYERDLHAWRRSVSQRFQHRPIVEASYVNHHRRHNLFKYAILATVGICWAVGSWFMISAPGSPIVYLLLVAGCVLPFPLNALARRVDATHRRPKWFDERPA